MARLRARVHLFFIYRIYASSEVRQTSRRIRANPATPCRLMPASLVSSEPMLQVTDTCRADPRHRAACVLCRLSWNATEGNLQYIHRLLIWIFRTRSCSHQLGHHHHLSVALKLGADSGIGAEASSFGCTLGASGGTRRARPRRNGAGWCLSNWHLLATGAQVH
jgi:hypothetical protein